MDRLRAITIFLSAAELGSFQRAAVAHGITPQAVSKTIRQLERELGVRLFHRTTRKSSLSEDGRRFLETVKPGLDEVMNAWSRAERLARDDEGLVRVAAARPIGRNLLVPIVVQFREQHPKIDVDLVLDERYADLVAERIDVGFRGGRPPDGQVVVRPLFPIQLVVCASPSYLARHGHPHVPDDLERHACTGYRMPNTGRVMPWEFQVGGEIAFRDVHAAFCTNDPEAELEAVLAGVGVGQLDSVLAMPHLRSGRLIALMREYTTERYGLYLYYPQRADMPKRVRHFVDFALAQLEGSPAYRVDVPRRRAHAS